MGPPHPAPVVLSGARDRAAPWEGLQACLCGAVPLRVAANPCPACPVGSGVALSWLACEAGPWGAFLPEGALTNRVIVVFYRANCCLSPWGQRWASPWGCGDRTQVLGRQVSKWNNVVPRGLWPCHTLAVVTEVGVLVAPSGQRPGLVLMMDCLPRRVSLPGSERPSWVAAGCAGTAPRLGSEEHRDGAGCLLLR